MNKRILIIIGIAIAVSVLAVYMIPESAEPNEKFGLVINTPNQSTSLQELDQIYSKAATSGIGRSNVYLFWDIIEPVNDEFDWQQSDILMSFNKKNNLDVTLYFSIINGRTLGPFPDWLGKPSVDSISKDHLFNALDAILSRYDIIDTVIIAGETESHFRYAEHNIPAYKELFAEIYEKLKEKHPDVKIGNTFALHHVLNKNLTHIVDELAIGDFVGFTYFPVDPLNDISKTPLEAKNDLQESIVMVPGKKVGFMEVGWSTSDFVDGNESDQMSFVSKLVEFYSENESEIEFLVWYRQYDREEGACAIKTPQESDNEIRGGLTLGSSEYVIERLEHYVCHSGLIASDGTPKPAWNEFQTLLKTVR